MTILTLTMKESESIYVNTPSGERVKMTYTRTHPVNKIDITFDAAQEVLIDREKVFFRKLEEGAFNSAVKKDKDKPRSNGVLSVVTASTANGSTLYSVMNTVTGEILRDRDGEVWWANSIDNVEITSCLEEGF